MPTQKHSSSKSSKELEKKKKKKKLKKDEVKDAKGKPKRVDAEVDAASLAREKLKRRGSKGSGEVDGDEVEERAIEMMGDAEVDADAEKDEADEEPVRERKEVQELIAQGKQKGFVTYDEVNDALPADVVSSDQIDDVMSMFGDNDIEVVDAQKSAEQAEVKPTVAAEEEQVEEDDEEEDDDAETPAEKVVAAPVAAGKAAEEPAGKSNNPVRLYLRKMGSVSLLTREGEVEIAKRIEDGEKEVMRALLDCKVAVNEMLDIGPRLRAGKLRVREVFKDAPEEPQREEEEEEEAEFGPEVEGEVADSTAPKENPAQRCRAQPHRGHLTALEKLKTLAKDVENLRRPRRAQAARQT